LGVRYARPTPVIVLTLAEAALHAERPSGIIHNDHRVRTVGLASAAQVLDLVSGTEYPLWHRAIISGDQGSGIRDQVREK
jgi:hypothetical protein